ncbi:MAG: hypothetical protein ACLFP1_03080 [Candidatus Goldiibacteriota bacterium]
MKPFECDCCGKKTQSRESLVVWHYEPENKSAGSFRIIHKQCGINGYVPVWKEACENNELLRILDQAGMKKEILPGEYFNRSLEMDFVFKHIPEFISYLTRLNVSEKEVKRFINRIEKHRSYIRRFNVKKEVVEKLIIRFEGKA